ncbi:MAG: PilZ domain-containing protein [Deltaproteobacteria bacterium]|nr:PilZ domain-containing protein [Deltaproteobacteria bacterium]
MATQAQPQGHVGTNGRGFRPFQGERRRDPRQGAEISATLVMDAASSTGAVRFPVGNISAGGLFLRSTLLFEVDEEFTIILPLADERSLSVTGRVVHVSLGERSGMGLAFLSLKDEDRSALRALAQKN